MRTNGNGHHRAPTSPLRRQPAVRNRQRGGYGLPPRLYERVRRDAERFGVTIPFVITHATAQGMGYHLSDEEDYAPKTK